MKKQCERFHSSRVTPIQARGKERLKHILSVSSKLFNEHGVASVTTNDIAGAAGIPVGSVYSYYDDKRAILVALAELYSLDLAKLTNQIHDIPIMRRLSWYEITLLVIDSWGYYIEQNGAQEFFNYVKSDPSMIHELLAARQRVQTEFCQLVHERAGIGLEHKSEPPMACYVSRGYIFATIEMMLLLETKEQKASLARASAEMISSYLEKEMVPRADTTVG